MMMLMIYILIFCNSISKKTIAQKRVNKMSIYFFKNHTLREMFPFHVRCTFYFVLIKEKKKEKERSNQIFET